MYKLYLQTIDQKVYLGIFQSASQGCLEVLQALGIVETDECYIVAYPSVL